MKIKQTIKYAPLLLSSCGEGVGRRGKKAFFCLLTAFLFFISSCSNNHCVEPMDAPMVVSFYSETNPSQQVSPKFLAIEGIGSNNFINASGRNSVQLSLKAFEESSRFSFTFANEESGIDTLVFLEKRNSANCPCSNPDEDLVSVYTANNNTFFLCNRSGNMLIFYKEHPEALFLKNANEDTLFVFQPTNDILSVKHLNTATFVSAECGCLTTFYLDEVGHTHNNITDVSITNQFVTGNFNEKHISIYFENY